MSWEGVEVRKKYELGKEYEFGRSMSWEGV